MLLFISNTNDGVSLFSVGIMLQKIYIEYIDGN